MLSSMEIASLRDKCISPFVVFSRVSTSRCNNHCKIPKRIVLFRSIRQRNLCSASRSDTLLANSKKDDEKKSSSTSSISSSSGVVSKKEEEERSGDLKSWMHKNGLPPCKVVLRERPSHNAKHRPIHYIAASEDLQAGDVAFSVPNLLVATLERVLGNETIGKVHFRDFFNYWTGQL